VKWELIIPLAGTVLAAVIAGIAKVWSLFQQGRLDCLERCAGLTLEIKELKAENRALMLELREQLTLSSMLREKNDWLSGKGSPPR
jgi:hypothetical protein